MSTETCHSHEARRLSQFQLIASWKPLCRFGWIVFAAAALHGQTFYSATKPDCSAIGNETSLPVTNSFGATVGYSCWIGGTFPAYAAGGGYASAMRVAAPASGAIQANYWFYDADGNPMSLDVTGSVTGSNNFQQFALNANQPSELDLSGGTGNGPGYSATATGSIYAEFFCPDAATCLNVQPQLLYTSPGNGQAWTVGSPLAWDLFSLASQWSFEGMDDGSTHEIQLTIYNAGSSSNFADSTPASFQVNVYNNLGVLVGSGTTPPIVPTYVQADGSVVQGGSYSDFLENVPGIPSPLPPGIFKVLIDGGDAESVAQAVQVNGNAATSLAIGFDTAPAGTNSLQAVKAPGASPAIRSNGIVSPFSNAVPARRVLRHRIPPVQGMTTVSR
jgi:hypothetical protein